jgi:polyisoprenoid-binding protein YceI
MQRLVLVAGLLAASMPAAAEPATYAMDPTHTFVTFEMTHFATSTNRGRFDKQEGSVLLDRAAKTGKVEVTIHTGSVSTGIPAFDKRLRSAHFFDSDRHPVARFVGSELGFNGDKVTEVKGHLTLLGRSNPVVLKATHFNCYRNPILQREVCGGDFETTLHRSQWGMGGDAGMGLPDAVRLLVQVEAVRQ